MGVALHAAARHPVERPPRRRPGVVLRVGRVGGGVDRRLRRPRRLHRRPRHRQRRPHRGQRDRHRPGHRRPGGDAPRRRSPPWSRPEPPPCKPGDSLRLGAADGLLVAVLGATTVDEAQLLIRAHHRGGSVDRGRARRRDLAFGQDPRARRSTPTSTPSPPSCVAPAGGSSAARSGDQLPDLWPAAARGSQLAFVDRAGASDDRTAPPDRSPRRSRCCSPRCPCSRPSPTAAGCCRRSCASRRWPAPDTSRAGCPSLGC